MKRDRARKSARPFARPFRILRTVLAASLGVGGLATVVLAATTETPASAETVQTIAVPGLGQGGFGVATDAAGDVFVSGQSGHIFVVPKTTGSIFGQSVTANTPAELNAAVGISDPNGLAVDAHGDLFVAGADVVWVLPAVSGTVFGQSVTANVAVTLNAFPSPYVVYTSGGGAADPNNVALGDPYDVAFDASGDLFVANGGSSTVSVLPKANGTIFGQAVVANIASNLNAVHQGFPTSIAMDSSGDLFISSEQGGPIEVVPASSTTLFGQAVTANTETALNAATSSGSQGSVGFDANGDLFYESGSQGTIVVPRSSGSIFGQSVTANVATTIANDGYFAFDGAGNLFGTSYGANVFVLYQPLLPSAPGTPTSVATGNTGELSLSWTPGANGYVPITSYTITPSPPCPSCTGLTVTGNPASSSTTIDGLTNGTPYTFTVAATNSVGSGPASPLSSPVAPIVDAASPPTAVTAAIGLSGSATVSWSAPSQHGSSVTSYVVTPSPACPACTGTTVSGTPPTPSTVVSGLTLGVSYTFTVTAVDDGGPSPASSASNAILDGAQTIAFTSTAPSSGQSGQTYAVSAVATSGLPVTFNVAANSTACVISGSTVSLLGSGTCVIDASQSGSSSYFAAPVVSQQFAVGLSGTTEPIWPIPSSVAIGTAGSEGPGLAQSSCSGANVYDGGTPTQNGTVSLVPTSTPGSAQVVVTITGAQPNATYAVSRTCSHVIGSIATNASGTGTGTFADTAAPGQSVVFDVGPGPSGDRFETPALTYEPQVITFRSTPPSAAGIGGFYALSATGGASNNPIVYSIDPSSTANACVLANGSTVAFRGFGTCVVDANQAGSATISAAGQVQQSFVIGAQTITFSSSIPTNIVLPSSPAVLAASSNSGLPVTFSVDPSATSVCSLGTDGKTLTFLAVGTCVVDANQGGNADFQAASPAQLSIDVTVPAPTLYGSDGSTVYQFSSTESPTSIDPDGLDPCPGPFTADDQGNVYVYDQCYGIIWQFQSGSPNPTDYSDDAGIDAGGCGVRSMTTDAAGDLFFDDYCDDIYEIPVGDTYAYQIGSYEFGEPGYLAADAAGDLFVTDLAYGNIVELGAISGYRVPSIVSNVNPGNDALGFAGPIAVDGSGNIFAVDPDMNQVTEIPVNGSPQTVISNQDGGSSLACPDQITVDADGNVDVFDNCYGDVVEIPSGGGEQTQVIGGDFGYYGLGAAGSPGTFVSVLTPTAPSTANLPASATHGTTFVASVATSSNGTTSVVSTTPSICTVGSDGLTVSFVGVGTCGLTPEVAASSTYSALSGPTQFIDVAQATPTLSYAPASLPYGAAPTSAQYDAVASVPGSFSYNFDSSSDRNVGTYTVTAIFTPNSPDYATTTVKGSLTITPAVLSVYASSSTSVYGTAVAPVTASYGGFDYNDSTASLTTLATCSTSASQSSPVGTYATTCSGAIDPNYTFMYVSGTVTITPAPLTITASSSTSVYGSGIPPVTPTYSGFVAGDSAASLTTAPVCSSNATASSPVGSYATSCSGAVDTNYAITTVAGTITVTPASLLVTAPSIALTYGSTIPALSPTYTGLVNSDTSASLTTPASCTTTATASSPVGTYATSCSGALDPNYAISYVGGSLSIGSATLTITASSGTSVYGTAPGTVTPTYSGFVNGDTASSLTTKPVCSTTVTNSSAVGTYAGAATCAGAVDPNYAIAYSAGSDTVTPAALSITASSGTSVYGSTPPTVTAGISGLVNGDTVSSLTTAPTCSTTATSSSPVGTYVASCSGATDPNYTITYTAGTDTVTPAALTISASSSTNTYGSTTATVIAGISGLVNNDTIHTALTTAPTCSTTATSSSPVGTYPTTCSGAVAPNYTITYVGGVATITPAALTISASSGTSVYGSTPPAVTAGISGLVNNDTVHTALTTSPTCATTAHSSSPVGVYATSCSGAVAPNYTITYVAGTDTVTPAALTISASSGTSVYGSTPPAVTAGYSGLVNNDTVHTALTTAPTCATTATSSSPVGVYATSCSGAVAPNYTITYVAGTDTVTPAALTVTASSSSSTYGSAVPAVTASYTGFVNGDTAAKLTTQPSCSTTAKSSSAVGVYPTTCSGAVAPNYTITYVAGTATITPAALTVTASSSSSVYGTTVPAVTASYAGFVNGDTAASLSTQPSCSTTATSSKPVGTYPTTCAGAVDANYTITSVAGTATITKATPVLTWAAPSSITSATPLSATQLDATASVPGTFVYSPAAGTTLGVGTDTLSVTFTPTDSVDYTTATKSVSITVTPGVVTVTPSALTIAFGAPNPAVFPTNVPTGSGITGSPSCSTARNELSPGGTYTVTCTQGTLTGPTGTTFTFAPGTLTVTYSQACLAGKITGPVVVASNQEICLGPTAVVSGGVTVNPGGSLDVEGATVKGPISETQAGSTRICGATITGAVTVNQASGAVWIGDGSDCAGNAINGAVVVYAAQGGVLVMGNYIVGQLTMDANAGGEVAAYDNVTSGIVVGFNTGGVIVTGDTDGGSLTVVQNTSSQIIVTGNSVAGGSTVQ
jgi:hypothetical protein